MNNDYYVTDFVDETQLKHKAGEERKRTYRIRRWKNNGLKNSHIEILQKDNPYNKKVGNYITITCPLIKGQKDYDEIIDELVLRIKYLLKRAHYSQGDRVLIVGLGNQSFMSDALGPLTVKDIMATSHLDFISKKASSVSTIIPGVMAMTGIESSSIVEAIVEKEQIDIIIVIDSLATSDIHRLYNVFQLSDTGINPGSGVNNKRKEISKEVLGIPVICIGVATVVDANSLIVSSFYKLGIEDHDKINTYLSEYINRDEKMIFTIKDIDRRIEQISSIISSSINNIFNAGLLNSNK